MPTVVREYKDLDLNFTPHPVSGDIIPLTGVDAVKAAIKNLVLMDYNELPFRPNVGSGVKQELFENADPATKYLIQQKITRTIQINEPRARVLDVSVIMNEDENRFEATITFAVRNFSDVVTLTVILERTR